MNVLHYVATVGFQEIKYVTHNLMIIFQNTYCLYFPGKYMNTSLAQLNISSRKKRVNTEGFIKAWGN